MSLFCTGLARLLGIRRHDPWNKFVYWFVAAFRVCWIDLSYDQGLSLAGIADTLAAPLLSNGVVLF